MGCGASSSGVAKAGPAKDLHSAIRWYSPEQHDEVTKKIKSMIGMANVSDKANGNVALHIAAQNGHTPVCKLLVDS